METTQNQSARTQLAYLVAQNGRIRTTAMLLALMLTPKPPLIRRGDLSDHLRRDIGLERAPPSPTYHNFL